MHKRKQGELKDSEVEWFDQIPTGWTITKLKFLIDLNPVKSKVDRTEVKEVAFVPMESVGEYGGFNNVTTKKIEDVYYGYTFFKTGDIVSAKITPCFENGKAAYVQGLEKDIAFGTTELNVLRPRNNAVGKFIFYLTISDHFLKIGESFMYGAGGQKRVPADFIENLKIPVPSKSEQKEISTFLDHKTHAIDQLIEKKRQLIEKLKEKRQALITRAVTKGLNPDVPMKDSGIEWLGEIPAHWEVTKTKFVTNKIIDGTHHTPTYTDEGVPFLRVTDIHDETINLAEVKRISKEEHKELSARCSPKKGDMLLSKNGTIGITKVINWDWEFSIFVSLCLMKFKERKILPFYYAYFFKSDIVDQQIQAGSKKTSVTNLHLDKIKELIVTLPSLNEQTEIISYLSGINIEYKEYLDKMESSIEKLKEYRQSLISAAVTGKIDVREEVEELAE